MEAPLVEEEKPKLPPKDKTIEFDDLANYEHERKSVLGEFPASTDEIVDIVSIDKGGGVNSFNPRA